MQTFKYGPLEYQVGDLYLPDAARPPVVCLLHGGFWRMPYGREEFAGIAKDLAAKGYAVWNIEYRRVGAPGGGWPGTFCDAALAVDHLAKLVDDGIALDLDRVVVAGHSAGGQLALCVSARSKAAQFRTARVRPVAVAALAAVSDLASAYATAAGNGAVEALLEGGPSQVPDRYVVVSPIELLPLRVEQLVIHGAQDAALPLALSQRYAAAAEASGDKVSFVELADAGHMDFLDPDSMAHARLCQWLALVTAPVRQILSLAKTAHDLTEAAYQKDASIRGEAGWHGKQRLLLADMALHLLQTALRDGEISEEGLKRNLFAILTISDQLMPGHDLKRVAEQLYAS